MMTQSNHCNFSHSDGEGEGQLSPPVGAGINSNSWSFRYGAGPGYGPPQALKPGEIPLKPSLFPALLPSSPSGRTQVPLMIRASSSPSERKRSLRRRKRRRRKRRTRRIKEKMMARSNVPLKYYSYQLMFVANADRKRKPKILKM